MPLTHYWGIIGGKWRLVTDDVGQTVMALWPQVTVTYRDDWQTVWCSASNKEPLGAMRHRQAPSCCNRHLKDYEGSKEEHFTYILPNPPP